MRFLKWLPGVVVIAIAIGFGFLACTRAEAPAEAPIVPDLELEALKEAVRWPGADVSAVMALRPVKNMNLFQIATLMSAE